jgi:IMP cyclohydrolase
MYRVSSRSFANRQCVEIAGRLVVVPREGHQDDVLKNPYIAYNCLRVVGSWAVAANGTHTDPIAEKLELGLPPRDALVATLLALDYEKDDYSTPRIAGVLPLDGDQAWLGIVRNDALVVRAVDLQAGRACYVATYEADDVRAEQTVDFDASDAHGAAQYCVDGGYFAELTNAVCSGVAFSMGTRFDLATTLVPARS